MGKIQTTKTDFAEILANTELWPPAGSVTFGFDILDDILKKIDSNGVITPLQSGFDNPLDFYLDSNVAISGDGSASAPFKTLTDLNNAILSLDPAKGYIAYVAPSDNGYGSEVIGFIDLAPNLSLVGVTPQNTGIGCNIHITATTNAMVNQYRNVAMNGIVTVDLTLAAFASISFQNGAFNINRIDNNPSAFISLQGGIGPTTIGGTIIMNGGVMFAPITLNPGSTLYCTSLLNLGGTFNMVGNSTLKTVGMLNPTNGYVDGTPDITGTPSWFTDAASNANYTGTLNKTVYGAGGGGSTPVPILYADLLTLYNTNSMSPGFYLITDKADNGIIVQAITTDRIAPEATGIFLNPDYQNVGDWSGVFGLTGVPYSGTMEGSWSPLREIYYVNGDVVTWWHLNYQVIDITQLNGTDPTSNTLAFVELPKATDMGYIKVSDSIQYEFIADSIKQRKDNLGNVLGIYNQYFQWGNASISNNNSLNGNLFNVNMRGALNSNTLTGGATIVVSNTFESAIQANTFNGLGIYQFFTSTSVNGCTFNTQWFPEIDETITGYIAKTLDSNGSTFNKDFDVTGLTTLDILSKNSYIGVVNITSLNPIESIDTFVNFPEEHPVRFFPASGLNLTFVNGPTLKCSGGVNVVLDGTNGDWVEFTMINGIIYQTKGETY